MKLLSVRAARGTAWMLGGFQVLGRQPLAYIALFLAFMFGLLVVAGLPAIGGLLALVLVPAGNVGFVQASRKVLAGERVTPLDLLAGLRGPRSRVQGVLLLGVAYAIAAMLVMALCDLIDPGFDAAMQDLLKRAGESTEPSPPPPGLAGGFLLRLLLPLPVTLLFWHAPVVAHRADVGVAKALFASWWACWRNRGAFALYLLSWGAVVAVVVGGLSLTARGAGLPVLAGWVLAPLVLVLSAAFYASLHFCVADCFDFEPPAAGSA